MVQDKDSWPNLGSGLEVIIRFNLRVGIQGQNLGSEFRVRILGQNQGQDKRSLSGLTSGLEFRFGIHG